MPLTIPGATTAQLVTTATPSSADSFSKLDPRFLSLLQQNAVSLENMAKLGTAGHIG